MASPCDWCFLYGRTNEKGECVCGSLSELELCLTHTHAHTIEGEMAERWVMECVKSHRRRGNGVDGVLDGERVGGGDECVLTV